MLGSVRNRCEAKRHSDYGFTIVEIIIVLAIVSLMFIIIFLAVHTAQVSQRDAARKDNVYRVVAAVRQIIAEDPKGAYPNPYVQADYIKVINRVNVLGPLKPPITGFCDWNTWHASNPAGTTGFGACRSWGPWVEFNLDYCRTGGRITNNPDLVGTTHRVLDVEANLEDGTDFCVDI